MVKKLGLGTWSWGNKLFWNYQKNLDNELFEVYKEGYKHNQHINPNFGHVDYDFV